MQDVVEDYFGHQRTVRGWSDNPSAQRNIAPSVSGNVGGRYGKQKWFSVSEEPVKKRVKKRNNLFQ